MNIERATATPAYRILVEKDVDIPVRDGARLKADILRPDDRGKFPAILNLGPYQKDKLWIPPDNLEEKSNPLMNWGTINPEWWVPKGYAAVRVDARGTGRSPGQFQPFSYAESLDFHDAIEWAARQPWCSGKVGLSGISYFAINQWFVANHQPPDMVVSRAGASSLGEYPLFGLPAVLVPYPHAWRYQKVNADFMTQRGAAVMLEDQRLKDEFLETLNVLLENPNKMKAMRASMFELSRPRAAEKIASKLIELAGA